MERAVLEKLTFPQSVKKFHTLYGTRRSTAVSTKASNFSLFWARSIQSTPSKLTSLRSIVIFFSPLFLVFPSCYPPSVVPTKSPNASLPCHIRATCPTHLILDLITAIIFIEECRSLSTSWRTLLHFPLDSSILGPNISPSANSSHTSLRIKVKQSCTGLLHTHSWPRVWGFQISKQSAHEGGKVSPAHRPPLPPRIYSWYSFLSEAE